jgi:hypothetical protein
MPIRGAVALIYADGKRISPHEATRIPEADREEVLRVFALRIKIWDGAILSEDDQRFWDSVRSAAPNWAIYKRLKLSSYDQREREEAEQACAKELEEFLADADEVSLSEAKNGIQGFSATFHLTDRPTEDEPANRKRPSFLSRISQKLRLRNGHK